MEENRLKDFFISGRSDSVGWALIFFWGALVLSAEVSGYSKNIENWNGWLVFFTGVGVIALSGVVFLFKYGRKDKAIWDMVFGFMMIALGTGDFLNLEWGWVIILVIIGYVILSETLKKRRFK